MKYRLFAVCLLFLSCKNEDVSNNATLGDVELSPYLVEKSYASTNPNPTSDPVWTKWEYDDNYFLKEKDVTYFPENLGSMSKPFGILGKEEIYVDQNRRLVKKIAANLEENYYYDQDGWLSYIVRDITLEATRKIKDTVTYQYYREGDGFNHLGEVLVKKQKSYFVFDQTFTTSLITTTEYYEYNRVLKSWTSRPYSTGKMIKAPLEKRTVANTQGLTALQFWYHTYDKNGLITQTRQNDGGFVLYLHYAYFKRPK
jgi:hypothetical protein